MKFLKLFAVLAALILSGNAFAVGNQYINPDEDKCNVQMPPTSSVNYYSNSGNKINYTLRADEEWLMATCLMTDITEGGDLPDMAIPFTADDFTSGVPPCRFRDPSNGFPNNIYTDDYHITVTPAGKIKLTCFFDLSD